MPNHLRMATCSTCSAASRTVPNGLQRRVSWWLLLPKPANHLRNSCRTAWNGAVTPLNTTGVTPSASYRTGLNLPVSGNRRWLLAAALRWMKRCPSTRSVRIRRCPLLIAGLPWKPASACSRACVREPAIASAPGQPGTRGAGLRRTVDGRVRAPAARQRHLRAWSGRSGGTFSGTRRTIRIAIPPGDGIGNWVLAAVLEEMERLGSFSSFYTGVSAQQRLEMIRDLGFGSSEMARRLRLLQNRFGLPAS
jgi:hypothetical protein